MLHSHLHLHLRATPPPRQVRGGNMAPTAAFACFFEGHGAVSARFISVGEASCKPPASAAPMTWPLTLTTDGALYSAPPLLFTRYDAAIFADLDAVSPLASGLALQALLTLSGTNFAPTPGFACQFSGEDCAPQRASQPPTGRAVGQRQPLRLR